MCTRSRLQAAAQGVRAASAQKQQQRRLQLHGMHCSLLLFEQPPANNGKPSRRRAEVDADPSLRTKLSSATAVAQQRTDAWAAAQVDASAFELLRHGGRPLEFKMCSAHLLALGSSSWWSSRDGVRIGAWSYAGASSVRW